MSRTWSNRKEIRQSDKDRFKKWKRGRKDKAVVRGISDERKKGYE